MSKKTLAIIVLFSIFFTLLLLDISLRSKSLLQSSLPVIQKPATQEPNTPSVNTPVKKEIFYQAISIQDDTHSITKLILIDSNQKETVIQQSQYSNMDGNIIKPNYTNFTFSPDNKFLLYTFGSGYEGANSFLYNIDNKQNVDIGFPVDTVGFTSNSKYFYACAQGGMMSGGAVIKELPQLKEIFNSVDEKSFSCEYNQSKKEILFSEFKISDPNEIVSQYVFSEQSGNLSKIK